MEIVIGKFNIPKIVEFEDENKRFVIYGDCYEDPNAEIVLGGGTLEYAIEEINKLNFDGGYVAFYLDKKHNHHVVFRSHMDTFLLFYTESEGKTVFSDDFYSLCSLHEQLTWNIKSIGDYYETNWKSICKYDRTPVLEIHKLHTWFYMEFLNEKDVIIKKWKNIAYNQKYTAKNLEEFKEAFFKIVDYYLKKVHNRNERILATISSGMDANTLAARFCQLYPSDEASFVTSCLDDEWDESKIAAYMQPVLTAPITYINVSPQEVNLLEELSRYVSKYVPPRSFGEINDYDFYLKIRQRFPDYAIINGLGADGLFGGFGGEYLYLMHELMSRGEYEKAKSVLIAVNSSFPPNGIPLTVEENEKKFKRWKIFHQMGVGNLLFFHRNRQGARKRDIDVLKIRLHSSEANEIRTYKDAMEFYSESSTVQTLVTMCNDLGIALEIPFEGYQFQLLINECDPCIFSDKVNKSCLRYAASELLPNEIIDNYVKSGVPSVSVGKIMRDEKNRIAVSTYLSSKQSALVDRDVLLQKVRDGQFGDDEFRGLALMIFEERLIEQGCKITL